jgi:hypothetical protein
MVEWLMENPRLNSVLFGLLQGAVAGLMLVWALNWNLISDLRWFTSNNPILMQDMKIFMGVFPVVASIIASLYFGKSLPE